MKKIFFIAIAMIAFTGTMNAQTKPETKPETKNEDKDCAAKRDKFINEKYKDKSSPGAKLAGQIYYEGCVEGKKANYIAPRPKNDTITVS
ncbi:hypothetical protein EG240_08500 [Paenimyroides tangerinum]|uniref:Uncharacterized protein n=1 Tax=Paenimyroides tangerinum TaxID=2488728 RepID=A0A3P3W887_9FLAO|nr:hypothetical protein [Paenimyroides tangerinum]RRJ90557.1 hypothetical protein EG240_08500 [Paenimyroides tangerinum]